MGRHSRDDLDLGSSPERPAPAAARHAATPSNSSPGSRAAHPYGLGVQQPPRSEGGARAQGYAASSGRRRQHRYVEDNSGALDVGSLLGTLGLPPNYARDNGRAARGGASGAPAFPGTPPAFPTTPRESLAPTESPRLAPPVDPPVSTPWGAATPVVPRRPPASSTPAAPRPAVPEAFATRPASSRPESFGSVPARSTNTKRSPGSSGLATAGAISPRPSSSLPAGDRREQTPPRPVPPRGTYRRTEAVRRRGSVSPDARTEPFRHVVSAPQTGPTPTVSQSGGKPPVPTGFAGPVALPITPVTPPSGATSAPAGPQARGARRPQRDEGFRHGERRSGTTTSGLYTVTLPSSSRGGSRSTPRDARSAPERPQQRPLPEGRRLQERRLDSEVPRVPRSRPQGRPPVRSQAETPARPQARSQVQPLPRRETQLPQAPQPQAPQVQAPSARPSVSPGIVRWTTIVTAISAVMMTLDITVVLVALPAVAEDLNLTLSGSQWVVNAYSLAFASLLLGVGAISDRLGRRTIFLLGQVIFVAASISCVLSGSETALVASRVVQGAGGALVFGTSIPLLGDCFGPQDEHRRTKAMAALMGAGAVASALGPLVGGGLVEIATWEWIFIVNIPVGLFVILVTLLKVPDLHRSLRDSGPRRPVDLPSTVLAAVALFSLNYAILSGPEDGWTAPIVLGTGAAGVLLGILLVLLQRLRGDQAMIDLRLFRIPSFATVTFAAFAGRLFSFGMMPFIVLWLSGHVGLSAVEIGYVSCALALPMVTSSIVAVKLGTRIDLGRIQAIGMAIVALGLGAGLLIGPDSSWTDLLPCYVIVGVGTGITLPHLMDITVSVVPPTKTGAATGIANTALPLGTSFGVAAYGACLTQVIADRMPDAPQLLKDATAAAQFDRIAEVSPAVADTALGAYVDGLHVIFLVAAGVALVAAASCLRFIRPEDRWAEERDARDDVPARNSANVM